MPRSSKRGKSSKVYKDEGVSPDHRMAIGVTRFINRIIKYSIQVLIIYTLFNIMFNSKPKKVKRQRTMGAHLNFDHSATIFKEEAEENEETCPLIDDLIIPEEDIREVLKEKSKEIPKYDTRKTRFLYPHLMQGLHGQIRGLRESIYLAIKLDRTLVLPPYFKDPWLDDAEASNQKIDERLLPVPLNEKDVAREEADMVECETTGNCTAEQHDIEEEIKLDHQYSVSLDSFDDDDFEPGLMWKQDYFKPKGNILPISAVVDIELQEISLK